jgi:hypothetical protein
MRKALKVLLLADLGEPATQAAFSGHAALAFEVAAAIREYQQAGGLEMDLVARRGSWRGLPLISLDPEELGRSPGDALSDFARTEALYAAFVLSGLTRGYHVIHCLAPLVAPLRIIANSGTPVLQTVVTPETHPSASLPPAIVPSDLLRQVAAFPGSSNRRFIAPPVDLNFYRPSRAGNRGLLTFIDNGERLYAEYPAKIAARLGVPCKRLVSGESRVRLRQLQHSLALLCLCETAEMTNWIWCLRALSCGTPVVAWKGGCFDSVLEEPNGLLAKRGDWMRIARRLRDIDLTSDAIASRRGAMLSRFGRRAIAASYREAYVALLARREGYFS